jgi:hypothetical protein
VLLVEADCSLREHRAVLWQQIMERSAVQHFVVGTVIGFAGYYWKTPPVFEGIPSAVVVVVGLDSHSVVYWKEMNQRLGVVKCTTYYSSVAVSTQHFGMTALRGTFEGELAEYYCSQVLGVLRQHQQLNQMMKGVVAMTVAVGAYRRAEVAAVVVVVDVAELLDC